MLLVAKLLGVPYERLALGIGRSTVHHAEFHFSPTEQAEYAGRAVPNVSHTEIANFRKEWIAIRHRLSWERLDVDLV